MENRYEKAIFEAVAEHAIITASSKEKDSLIVRSLNVAHYLGERRLRVFDSNHISTIKSDVIHPITFDLMTSSGSCASFSMVLSRVLTEMHIRNRILQMTVNGKESGHVIVEAESSKGWVVLDPSYDLFFKKPNGDFASFNDINSNWNWYKNQLPRDYNINYKYEGVRYTNWNKIPVVMPALKKILYLTIGKKETDVLSLRSIFLRKFKILFISTSCLYLLLLLITYRTFRSSRQKSTFIVKVPTTSGMAKSVDQTQW